MERIDENTPPGDRLGHEFRYHLASGFVSTGDMIMDAACGVGYGMQILMCKPFIRYIGVDKNIDQNCKDGANVRFHEEDLVTWHYEYDFDVFVGFETIEHLSDYSNYIELAKRAGKWMILSVPVVPTVGINPYHLHDFTSGELPNYIADDNWSLYQGIGQPSELSEIYVFKRKV